MIAQQLRAGSPIDWSTMDRSPWSRFIPSLMLRNPEFVARMSAEVADFYARTDNEEKYKAMGSFKYWSFASVNAISSVVANIQLKLYKITSSEPTR